MIKFFIRHYLNNIIRNQIFNVSIILKLFVLFSIIYLSFAILILGLNFGDLVDRLSPTSDPITIFNTILIYYFPIDIILRFYFPKEKQIPFSSYLTLPIGRSKLITYYLVFYLFNYLNLYFLLFFIPFSLVNILPAYGIFTLIKYIVFIFLILILLNYFALLIRNLLHYSLFFGLVPWFGVFIILFLRLTCKFCPEIIATRFFLIIVQGQIFWLGLLMVSVLTIFLVNIAVFKRALYEKYITLKASKGKIGIQFNTLLKNRLNLYAILELKLISRNRRLQSMFILTICLLALFYYIFLDDHIGSSSSLMICILLVGIFGYMYGQYLFSWESNFYDFLSASHFSFSKYLETIYYSYVFTGFIVFILLLSLVLQNQIDLHILFSSLLFNCGIGYFVIIYAATYNRDRLEINYSPLFNTKGYNISQLIALLVILFVPFLLQVILTSLFSETIGLSVLNAISVYSLLNKRKWMSGINRSLHNRKYINLEGFRK